MNAIPPIFKDENQQSLFDKNGFVKVKLLNPGPVQELLDLFNQTRELHQIVRTLHHTTTDTQNTGLITKVDAKIKAIFMPELEKILCDFKPLAGCFHVKECGVGSATGMHQDPTFVDETQYCSANVWLALQDIDERNGNLFFVNGSNHAAYSLRITPDSPVYYKSFSDSLPELVTHVSLKKGEAVIFNNATIHGATDNSSNDLRLAATLLVCSSRAQWLLYYRAPGSVDPAIEEYHLDFDSFVSMPKDGRPGMAAFKKNITFQFPQLTKNDFLKRTSHDSIRGGGYFQKIRKLIKG